MEQVHFCKTGVLVLLLLGTVISSPLHEVEEAIVVPTIQFASKTADRDVCTAYQIRGHLFVTLARCLGDSHSAINQLTAIDVFGQGTREIQAFAIRGPETEASKDLAAVIYNGPLTDSGWTVPDRSAFLGAFGFYPVERFEREDEEAGAAAIKLNMRLIGSVMALIVSVVWMK